MARQAITTKFLGPTNHRGARIKAVCKAGSLTVAWDLRLNAEENHANACVELADKFGWLNSNAGYRGQWHMGWDNNENGVHVFVGR